MPYQANQLGCLRAALHDVPAGGLHVRGYPYPHSPLSKCCEHHPMAVLHSAERAGEPQEVLDDIALELALAGVGKKSNNLSFLACAKITCTN